MYEILSTLKLTIKSEIRNFSEIIFFSEKSLGSSLDRN